jgi:putative phosphonate metabolism protein
MRHAIYFTPGADDPLTQAAAAWLGRDAFTGKLVSQPVSPEFTIDDMARLTDEPRRYGFHATLVAPFRLADGATAGDLEAALASFCQGRRNVTIPRIRISRIGSFFALTPEAPLTQLDRLAADLVTGLAPLRAPLSPEEIARRRPDELSARQRDYLKRWGYPYVLDEYRFHMTLTGQTAPRDRGRIAAALDDWFGGFVARPLDIASVSIFVEDRPGAPFTHHASVPLGQ